jgi:hypothetical protein
MLFAKNALNLGLYLSDPWLVLVTNSQRTGRIVRSLEEYNIPHFAPRTLSDVGRLVWLFPTYIFALLSGSYTIHDLWAMRGVRRVIPLDRHDVVRLDSLRNQAINNLIMNQQGESKYKRGQILYINDGPFNGHKCSFDCQVSSMKCSVVIQCFGRETKVTVEEGQLSVLANTE